MLKSIKNLPIGKFFSINLSHSPTTPSRSQPEGGVSVAKVPSRTRRVKVVAIYRQKNMTHPEFNLLG